MATSTPKNNGLKRGAKATAKGLTGTVISIRPRPRIGYVAVTLDINGTRCVFDISDVRPA